MCLKRFPLTLQGSAANVILPNLCSTLFQISNQIVSILFFLEAAKGHLCSWNVLFGILQVCEQCIFRPVIEVSCGILYKGALPYNSFLFICVGVLESFYLSSLSSKQPMQTVISINVFKKNGRFVLQPTILEGKGYERTILTWVLVYFHLRDLQYDTAHISSTCISIA